MHKLNSHKVTYKADIQSLKNGIYMYIKNSHNPAANKQ